MGSRKASNLSLVPRAGERKKFKPFLTAPSLLVIYAYSGEVPEIVAE